MQELGSEPYDRVGKKRKKSREPRTGEIGFGGSFSGAGEGVRGGSDAGVVTMVCGS